MARNQMTQDDIQKLAIEASDIKAETWSGGMDMTWDEIERFANLVAEHERERISKMLIDEGWLMAAKLAEVKQ
jgi:hypothetical protein